MIETVFSIFVYYEVKLLVVVLCDSLHSKSIVDEFPIRICISLESQQRNFQMGHEFRNLVYAVVYNHSPKPILVTAGSKMRCESPAQ